jgi:alanine-glyoxylate transaminase/(R)-3-amino-2-methylpropionate-pyruvate transaminase
LQLNIVEGKMQYLFDESGRRYLDAFAGIVTVSVGHGHPAVVDAVVKQTKLLQHTTTIYLHHAIANYAEALAQRMPGNLKVQSLCCRISSMVPSLDDLNNCSSVHMFQVLVT